MLNFVYVGEYASIHESLLEHKNRKHCQKMDIFRNVWEIFPDLFGELQVRNFS